MKCLKSQEMRKLAPELDPLRIGTGWKPEELAMPQVIIESTAGDSHPGSGHLHILVDEVKKESPRQAATARNISAPISATARAREPMESTTALQAVR